jgi:hypothetical protein
MAASLLKMNLCLLYPSKLAKLFFYTAGTMFAGHSFNIQVYICLIFHDEKVLRIKKCFDDLL